MLAQLRPFQNSLIEDLSFFIIVVQLNFLRKGISNYTSDSYIYFIKRGLGKFIFDYFLVVSD